MKPSKGLRFRASDSMPLALFTLFFLGNALLGYLSLRNVTDDLQQAAVARDKIALIDALLIEVLHAETRQRGYLLTGVDTYADPYLASVTAVNQKITDLGAARFDPEQSNRFYELQQLVQQRLTELQHNYELARRTSRDEVVKSILSHRGFKQMNDINDVANAMKEHERSRLEISLAAAEERRLNSFVLMLAASIVGLGLVLLSLKAVRSSMQKEQKYMAELVEAKEDLEYKVSERTSALQHFSNELKRSNRELQDFAFVASHDLQEPLRKIRAFGDRLHQNFAEKLGAQGADYIQRMQSASERMSRLINDLLSFSRITTKAKPFLPVALNRVVDEVLDDLEVAIEEAGATVRCGDLPEIDGDLFQMKQLFQNLIANAIKFRKPDVPPVITVTADPPAQGAEDNKVTIRITDNGIGFDEVFLDRIFLPFQRLHGRSEYSGTGIGLAICRRVAERHGGSVSARSQPGIGSTFIVTLARHYQAFDFEEQAA